MIYFDDKRKNLDKKVKTKHLLIENELKKLQSSHSILFIGQSYYNNDGAELYLIFQPIYKTITAFSGLKDTISECEFKGLSNEKIESPFTANKSLSPKLVSYNYKIKLKFEGSCLKQEEKAAFTLK